MVVEFAKAASLLLSLCLIYSLIAQRWQDGQVVGKVLAGLLFGGVCVIGMMSPVNLSPGVFFDARSVVLSLAGLFGGPTTGVIAGVIAGAYRLHLGGGGAPVGIAVVAACVSLGIAFHYAHRRGRLPINFLTLLLFGLAVHLVVIGIFTQLPPPVVAQVMDTIAVPLVVVFTPATAVLGAIIKAIDDQIATRKALVQSEARLKAIVEHTPNGLILKDRAGRFLLANPTYAGWVGKSVDWIIGRTARDMLPEADAAEVAEADRKAFASRQLLIHEVSRQFPGIGRRDLRVYRIPIVLGDDRDQALITLMVDITAEKQTQQNLRTALDLAQEANRAKTQFLATMSHELRTPLNAIIGFSEILAGQYFGPPGAGKYREYAKDIHASAEYLLNLVEDLLDISAIEAGASVLNPVAVNVEKYAHECIEAAIEKAYQKGVEITLDMPGDLPPAMADPRALKQVFFNLLINAIKFTPQGGRVEIAARADGPAITVSVKDTGPGIEPHLLPRLLEPFARAEYDPFKTEKGWGLGLSITNSLVKLQGGELRINSTLGVGTEVSFTLPSAAAQPMADAG